MKGVLASRQNPAAVTVDKVLHANNTLLLATSSSGYEFTASVNCGWRQKHLQGFSSKWVNNGKEQGNHYHKDS
ncbi:unnamed protein product [Prunus armeniaca]|uniref:Uncharacterized protein n=1 Tax=Prunus armeniaca TaxID=36596 RepID=A0A6J5V0A8_PRUAR|nr:unnamed protein product [Prunus armeniaca]